jgi:hypothetical protein
MPKFRKKPVVIEAYQWKPDDMEAAGRVGAWLQMNGANFRVLESRGLYIGTLEDGADESVQVEHVASPGDWIIKGVQNEIYPCKPEIFATTYEAVEV